MKGFSGFESWDETYVHTKHNEKDRTVLEYAPRASRRSRGRGCARRARAASSTPPGATTSAPGATRASRTCSNAASAGPCGQDPAARPALYVDQPGDDRRPRKDVKPFEYVEAKIPFYPPRAAGQAADPLTKMQKPLSVDESR